MDERVGSFAIYWHYPQLFTKTFPPNLEGFYFPSLSFFLSIEALWGKLFHNSILFFSLSNPFLPTQISSRKMPIEMPKGLPFSVDTWTSSSKRKRHHFLTHAHKDHSFGISSHFSFPIYSTLLTKTLVLQHYPQVCLCFQGFFLKKKKKI